MIAEATPRRSGNRDYRREANRRWPDAMDMVEPAVGRGRYATVAWCAGLTVHLHDTQEVAIRAFSMMAQSGCGHDCWGDHELVDLDLPQLRTISVERTRAARRIEHFLACRICDYVFSGLAAWAATTRRGERVQWRVEPW